MLTVHHLGKSQSERIVWLCEELQFPYELKRYARDSVTMLAPDFVQSEIHKRAYGPDGKLVGDSTIAERVAMPAEECAALIVGAMERRQRLLITSLRGKLGRFVRLVAPTLIDRIAARAIRRGV